MYNSPKHTLSYIAIFQPQEPFLFLDTKFKVDKKGGGLQCSVWMQTKSQTQKFYVRRHCNLTTIIYLNKHHYKGNDILYFRCCGGLLLPSSLCIGDEISTLDLPRSQCDLGGSHSGSLQIPITHVPEQLQAWQMLRPSKGHGGDMVNNSNAFSHSLLLSLFNCTHHISTHKTYTTRFCTNY